MELIRRCRPAARSSSAMRRAGFASAARSISARCWCFPTGPRPGPSRRLRRTGWRRFVEHGGVELLLLGFGRRMAPVSAALRSRAESRRDRGRGDGYRRGLPHLQYAAGRGPPRRRGAVAASLSEAARDLRLCTGHHRVEPVRHGCPRLACRLLPLFRHRPQWRAAARSGRGLAAFLLEKGACPRLEDAAARDRAGPSRARRGARHQLSRIHRRAARHRRAL